ncbi:hypothetical protein DFQ28_011200 [Apophysomyces sp. BC1034]|nr:hypothetical protein DFQ30_010871 [Apophysomyces sp. BC1015]KAG0169443.1 hypothetical protein DFQ29_009683 [Apophysomyces sp. BC1021]KAG0184401.1 hypothetical protein DFQ28_011200 [Apophysomyces sp. BC1034]
MDFEDIVDMEWLDSHTTEDANSAELTTLNLHTHLGFDDDPHCKMEEDPVIPTTEQIKHLIEVAKQHIALHEQQQVGPSSSIAPLATVSPDSLVKLPSPPQSRRRESTVSTDDGPSLEAMAEADGLDIKTLTPKERRQLRNKISARNFRVRRKEYITSLEQQVDQHKKYAEDLLSRLDTAEDENQRLRLEVDSLKQQNRQLLQQQPSMPDTAPSSSSSSASSSPRIIAPNLSKDISMLGTKPRETYRQDTSILVSSAVMPVWDYTSVLSPTMPHTMQKCAEQFVLSCFAEWTKRPTEEASYMEQLYDTLIVSSLQSSDADKDFWWWEETTGKT